MGSPGNFTGKKRELGVFLDSLGIPMMFKATCVPLPVEKEARWGSCEIKERPGFSH